MGDLLWGDVLVQLFYLIILVLIIMLFVSLFRSQAKRQKQLNRIEQKIDELKSTQSHDHQEQ
ncbi:hypothetical protein [Virgibacillus senegalensis]|uniref:hypothetical protein n=1 Tax=Virgibacillus senegalensis TaxID=1499679 RepID=UPI00069DDEAE|nr:hypothetical protein [Virgibacillus senegalensis]